MANTTKELINLSLSEAAELVAKKEVSPVDLVDACLERINEIQDSTKAFITVYEKEARKVAKAMEEMLSVDHYLGPLHGIPLTLKDNIGLKGLKSTAGSKVLENWIPEKDATVASRLKGAGAIFIAKTNLHEFAWGGTSDNPHYGAVRNPWDTSRFPGGSSGGSGVAVAARSCFGSLGTDTGGSVRLPSAINGIVGLRPTIGRVSNYGVIPLAWSMDTVGPMARTAQDAATIFNVIAGYDHNDPGTALKPTTNYLADLTLDIEGKRIGIVPGYFFHHLQPPVLQAVKVALNTFEELGASLVEVELEHIHGNISAQLTVEAAEPSSYHQRWLREQPDNYGEDVRTLLEMGELLLATHYIQAQRYRSLLLQEFIQAFKSVDCFICPTLPFTATRVGEVNVVIEEGSEEDMLSAIMQFTGVPSLTGLPSLNVPCGFDPNGLPVGMQIIGRPFDEAFLFRMATAFQRATDFHKKAPTF